MSMVDYSYNIRQLTRIKAIKGLKPFTDRLREANLYPLKCGDIKTLQVNIGKICNLSCRHCHVEAGPKATESMSQETMEQCLLAMENNNIPSLDITGGAPELNPHLTWFISRATLARRHVIVRTNLTLLETEEHQDLLEFFAANQVEIVSSLPCYCEENTERQRGRGVFSASIKVLKRLNDLGYGKENSALRLNLVYNPGGAFLPGPQQDIEADFRRELYRLYSICFNKLFTITNVPVGRFLTSLDETGSLEEYMKLLASSFNPSTVGKLMCRELISVGWDGQLYDCDFNQMLGLKCQPTHIQDFDLAVLQERNIVLHNHCYACTAGNGSSCSGATA